MPRKRHTAEEIVTKLRQVDVLTSQGRPVAEAVRTIGVTEVTYYRWRSEYGGLKGDQVKRLKTLESENKQLRRPERRENLRRPLMASSQPGRMIASASLHQFIWGMSAYIRYYNGIRTHW